MSDERVFPCDKCGAPVMLAVAGSKDLVTPAWADGMLVTLCWSCSGENLRAVSEGTPQSKVNNK